MTGPANDTALLEVMRTAEDQCEGLLNGCHMSHNTRVYNELHSFDLSLTGS